MCMVCVFSPQQQTNAVADPRFHPEKKIQESSERKEKKIIFISSLPLIFPGEWTQDQMIPGPGPCMQSWKKKK